MYIFISRVDAMRKIQTLLRNKEFEEAVGLLRAARYLYLNLLKFSNFEWSKRSSFKTVIFRKCFLFIL
jgi:hypothetical protein